MILKLQDNRGGWLFIDDISNVQICKNCHRAPDSEGSMLFETDTEHILAVDDLYISPYASTKGSSGTDLFNLASCQRKSSDNVVLAFNGEAYLLSDAGKTVERI